MRDFFGGVPLRALLTLQNHQNTPVSPRYFQILNANIRGKFPKSSTSHPNSCNFRPYV